MSLGKRQKFLLFGFVAVLLIAIPATLYLLQQQQETRTRAEKATLLSYDPPSTATAPIEAAVGDQVDLNLVVNPGTNQVSIMRIEIQYDPTKLEPASEQPMVANSAIFSGFLEGPIIDKAGGKIAATLSIDTPTKAIQVQSNAATISFTAKEATGTTPTQVTYTTRTQVLSVASTDQHGEDVLSGTTPAFITILGEEPEPTEEETPTPTDEEEEPTEEPEPTDNPGTGTSPNEAPVCESINIDRETEGVAPYSLTFTAIGGDTDGTVNKVTFNFGDGPVTNVTEAGGIGTSSVSAQIAHTYNNPGTYVASAVMTDDRGTTSGANSCSVTITVSPAPTQEPGTGSTDPIVTQPPTPVPSLPETGPGDVFLGIGAVLGIMTAIGGLLFFML